MQEVNMKTNLLGLKIGSIVKNKKTSKIWIVTDFVTSYSSVKKRTPDQFKIRLSNSMNKSILVDEKELNEKFDWNEAE